LSPGKGEMNAQQPSDERIGALIEGELSPEDRARLIRELAENPSSLERLAEAAKTLEDLRAGESTGARSAPRTAWRPMLLVPLAAAAVIALVLTVPMLRSRGSAGDLFTLTDGLVPTTGDGGLDRSLGSGWILDKASAQRGTGQREMAFVVGEQMTDVRLALAARDFQAARVLIPDLVQSLHTLEVGAPFAARANGLATGITRGVDPGTLDREAERMSADLHTLLKREPWFELASWVESARLAARARNSAFFVPTAAARSELTRLLADREDLPEQVRTSLEALATEFPAADAIPNWERLLERLRALRQSAVSLDLP
jgi:hypothetical protein